jgi:hypothetical protein
MFGDKLTFQPNVSNLSPKAGLIDMAMSSSKHKVTGKLVLLEINITITISQQFALFYGKTGKPIYVH